MQFKCSITRAVFTASRLLNDKVIKEVMPKLLTLEIACVHVKNRENCDSHVHIPWLCFRCDISSMTLVASEHMFPAYQATSSGPFQSLRDPKYWPIAELKPNIIGDQLKQKMLEY